MREGIDLAVDARAKKVPGRTYILANLYVEACNLVGSQSSDEQVSETIKWRIATATSRFLNDKEREVLTAHVVQAIIICRGEYKEEYDAEQSKD
jgi:hypothetical protein